MLIRFFHFFLSLLYPPDSYRESYELAFCGGKDSTFHLNQIIFQME
jgi:hypothetical protein